MHDRFTRARGRLVSGKDSYICDALSAIANYDTYGIRDDDDDAVGACLEVIDEGINGAYCLQTWLIKELAARNISVNPAHFGAPMTAVGDAWRWVMRQARLAWLDKLIEEYSE